MLFQHKAGQKKLVSHQAVRTLGTALRQMYRKDHRMRPCDYRGVAHLIDSGPVLEQICQLSVASCSS
jgi:hypothetical protein